MAEVDESSYLNDTLLLGVVGFICFFILVAFLSTSFTTSDLKFYLTSCCSTYCRCCNPPSREFGVPGSDSNPRAQDSSNFVDLGGIDEAIDFTLQTPSKKDTSQSVEHAFSIIPKSLKVDPLLCFDRRNVHFTSVGTRGKFGFVSRGILEEPDGSHREIIIRSISADKTENTEVQTFYEDLLKFHEINSDNVLKLAGIDYIQSPLLAIFDDGIIGDLKMFIRDREEEDKEFVKKEMQIAFCRDIVAGLKFWHQNFTIPLDFAARTCQVSTSFQIKIGDIGYAESVYPEDYVDIYKLMNRQPQESSSDRLYPIRWLSPEILQGLRGGKMSSFITRQNNIWTLGMTFWEILTFGKQPYPELSNRQVFYGDSSSKLETTMNFDPSTFFCLEEKIIQDLTLKCLQIDPRARSDIFTFDSFLQSFVAIHPEERQRAYSDIWNRAFSH